MYLLAFMSPVREETPFPGFDGTQETNPTIATNLRSWSDSKRQKLVAFFLSFAAEVEKMTRKLRHRYESRALDVSDQNNHFLLQRLENDRTFEATNHHRKKICGGFD